MKPNPSAIGFLTYILLLNHATAYWRMPCMGVVGRGLVDPVVSPGKPSSHLHTIKGASAISDNSTMQDLLSSNCTSCQIAQDKSAYWTPQLYFFDSDRREFEIVPEVSGALIYYKYVPHFIDDGSYVMPIAIPNGMKMLSGNPFRRNMTIPNPDPPRPWTGSDATQDALAQKAIGFNCLYDPSQGKAPEGTLERHYLPTKDFLETNCLWGIRMELLMPTCWDSKNLDSPDHKSHLAYGDAGANGGRCPKGYDQPIMQILMETIYPTGLFKGRNGYYTLSNGDPTGYGYHGDAMISWLGTTQQDAVRDCGNPDPKSGAYATDGVVEHCPHFQVVDPAAQSTCTMAASQPTGKANLQALLASLPGNNPIQSGPQQATPPAGIPNAVSHVAVLPTKAPSPRPAAATSTGGALLQISSTSFATSTTMRSSTTPSTATSSIVTPAPVPAALPKGEKIVTTVTYTSNGAVYDVVNVEITETTTVIETVPPSRHRKRFEHIQRHREHIHNRHR